MADRTINVEDPVGRTVGRRSGVADALVVRPGAKADAEAWRRVFGGLRVKRGVYRFRSHDEADEWLWQAMARARGPEDTQRTTTFTRSTSTVIVSTFPPERGSRTT